MRAAHKPFNSPLEYRNVSNIGVVGDNIMELDDHVGSILNKLDELQIKDNTVVIFLSDNGADGYFKGLYGMTGHHQNSLDFNGRHRKLMHGKESLSEGGHRLPMIWRWPKKFEVGQNSENTVSYIDVYRTLADIVSIDLKCNQAPDESKKIKPTRMQKIAKKYLIIRINFHLIKIVEVSCRS